jgi:outer membrane protein assembly factor BamB
LRECRRIAALAVVIAGMAVPNTGARASDDVSRIEPMWHAAGPADGRHVAADELGVVMTGGSGDVRAVGSNGDAQWQASIALPDEYFDARPALGGGLVIVPVSEQRVVALDRTTGTPRWQRPADGVLAAAVGDGPSGPLVVTVSPTAVGLVSAVDGALLWSAALDIERDRLTAVPRAWTTAGQVLVVWGDSRTSMRAFDLASGGATWSQDLPNWSTLPAVEGDGLFFVANKTWRGTHVVSEARRLDVATGALRWARRITGAFIPSMLTDVEGSKVVVVGTLGQVTALRASDGAVLWRRRTFRTQYENAPRIVGPVVAFTTYGTGLVALSVADGNAVSNAVPGRAETFAIIDDSAAANGQLYLLVRRSGATEGEVWMLSPQAT